MGLSNVYIYILSAETTMTADNDHVECNFIVEFNSMNGRKNEIADID